MPTNDLQPLTGAVFALVTCHTKDCENENISIMANVDSVQPSVMCGPCGQDITDIIYPNNDSSIA